MKPTLPVYLLQSLQGHLFNGQSFFFFENIYWLCVFNLARDYFPFLQEEEGGGGDMLSVPRSVEMKKIWGVGGGRL